MRKDDLYGSFDENFRRSQINVINLNLKQIIQRKNISFLFQKYEAVAKFVLPAFKQINFALIPEPEKIVKTLEFRSLMSELGSDFTSAIRNLRIDFLNLIQKEIELSQDGLTLANNMNLIFEEISKIDYIVNPRTAMEMISLVSLQFEVTRIFDDYVTEFRGIIQILSLEKENLSVLEKDGEELKGKMLKVFEERTEKDLKENKIHKNDYDAFMNKLMDKIESEKNEKIEIFNKHIDQYCILKDKFNKDFSQFKENVFNEITTNKVTNYDDFFQSLKNKISSFKDKMQLEIEIFDFIPLINKNQILDMINNFFQCFIEKSEEDFKKIENFFREFCRKFTSEIVKKRSFFVNCYIDKDTFINYFDEDLFKFTEKINWSSTLNFENYKKIFLIKCSFAKEHFILKSENIKRIVEELKKILNEYYNTFECEFSIEKRQHKENFLTSVPKYHGNNSFLSSFHFCSYFSSYLFYIFYFRGFLLYMER